MAWEVRGKERKLATTTVATRVMKVVFIKEGIVPGLRALMFLYCVSLHASLVLCHGV